MQRRSFLQQIGGGFGWLAAADLLARDTTENPRPELNGGLHHRAKVKRIIQLFMTGGASPMDTFDYKPALEKVHGQKLGPKEKPEGFTAMPGALMKSPFKFQQHGESGRWVSSVFPNQAKWVDEMAFLMAMTTKTNVHGPATYMMNSGFLLPAFPASVPGHRTVWDTSPIICLPLLSYPMRKDCLTTSAGRFPLAFFPRCIRERSSMVAKRTSSSKSPSK